MYMANRASDFFPEAAFAVAHCNFALRGEESDGDEAFVREWCSGHGIKCFVKRFDTKGLASLKGISIEMAARELRYAWFAELCEEHSFSAVAVAHNANDNAETLILNLLRGTGSRGLRGMEQQERIRRPLLSIGRDEIWLWMTQHGCSWREDRTNAESSYKRNRIRNEIFPQFAQINPSFIRTLNEDMRRFAQADNIAEDYFQSVRGGVCGEDGAISVTELLAVKHWEYVLWRLLEPYNFSGPTFDKLVDLLHRYEENPLGTVTLGGKSFESADYILKASGKKLRVIPR